MKLQVGDKIKCIMKNYNSYGDVSIIDKIKEECAGNVVVYNITSVSLDSKSTYLYSPYEVRKVKEE